MASISLTEGKPLCVFKENTGAIPFFGVLKWTCMTRGLCRVPRDYQLVLALIIPIDP